MIMALLTTTRTLYNRTEIDKWLMARTRRLICDGVHGATEYRYATMPRDSDQ
jgi:hypothetical protein